MALKVFCGGVWTATRAEEAGYVIESNLCQLCGLQPDTLEHRLLDCPECHDVRSKHRAAFRTMKACINSDKLLRTRGIMVHPADSYPPPAQEGNIKVVKPGGDAHRPEALENLGGNLFF